MRVCVDLTPQEMFDRHGGIGRYAVCLLRALADLPEEMHEGVELTAVVSSRGPVLTVVEAMAATGELGAEISPRRHHRQRRMVLGTCLRQARIDIFHATQPRALPWLPGCKVISTAHDIIPVVLRDRDGPKARLRRVIHRRRYSRPDHVVADSETTRRDMVDHLGMPPERIAVVHLGVDLERYRSEAEPGEAARVRARFTLPDRWFLCVGSDHFRKNHRQLVDAWCQVAECVPEGLVFVGKTLYEDYFDGLRQEIHSKGLGTRFRWLNDVDDDALPALYRGATAAVAPSRYEGFGMTLLESMACGTAVLASRNGVYEEVARDAAEYFSLGDTAELAELLVRFSGDGALRSALAQRGHRRAQQMTWRHTAVKTLQLYRSLGNRGRGDV